MHVLTLAAWTMFLSFPPAATDVAGAAAVTVAGAVAAACVAGAGLVLLLRPSSRRGWSRILVSEGYRVRVSHVSVDPACCVSKWTKSRNEGEVRQ